LTYTVLVVYVRDITTITNFVLLSLLFLVIYVFDFLPKQLRVRKTEGRGAILYYYLECKIS